MSGGGAGHTVLAPAETLDPHGILTFANWKFYPELAGHQRWEGRLVAGAQSPEPPIFEGDEGLAFPPDILPNGAGLPLWRPWLAERLRALCPEAACFIPAELRIRGWRKPLAEGAVLVMPRRVYGPAALDLEALARACPEFAAPDAPPLRKAPRIFLSRGFRPAHPLFALSALGLARSVLTPELARALGPLDLVHSLQAPLSAFGFGRAPPPAHPTAPETFAAELPARLAAARRAKPPPPDPAARAAAAAEEAAWLVARAEVLALFARIGRHMLSGNREDWSELVRTEAGYEIHAGQTDGAATFTTTISEDEAWERLRARAMEGLGLYTFAERARARPEPIAAWYREIWA